MIVISTCGDLNTHNRTQKYREIQGSSALCDTPSFTCESSPKKWAFTPTRGDGTG